MQQHANLFGPLRHTFAHANDRAVSETGSAIVCFWQPKLGTGILKLAGLYLKQAVQYLIWQSST